MLRDLLLERELLDQRIAEARAVDFTLPEFVYDEDDRGIPEVAQVAVENIDLNLVNWYDYRGWEVRLRAQDFSGVRPDDLVLGWLTARESYSETTFRFVLAQNGRHDGPEAEFPRRIDAIRWAFDAKWDIIAQFAPRS